jgi:phage terminase small subunit
MACVDAQHDRGVLHRHHRAIEHLMQVLRAATGAPYISTMPKLNPRQERFCQFVTRGISANRAYPMAGYKPHRSNCWRLSVNERTQRRIAELSRHFARKTGVTVASLTEELDNIIRLAEANNQAGAMVQAIQVKARLHGFLVTRTEHGAPGGFSGLTTAAEIIEKVRNDAGDEAAQVIADYIARRTGVSASDADETKPSN